MKFLIFLPLFLFSQDFEFIRYYKNEKDFKNDVRIDLIKASKSSHIQALFSKNQILSKIYFDENFKEISSEVYDYDSEKSLFRTVFYKKNIIFKMSIFGKEKMSDVFIKYAFNKFNQDDFSNRITNYYFNDKNKIERYEFLSSNNSKLGEIKFTYFDEGFIQSEKWINLLSGKNIRSFEYIYDKKTQNYIITEFDSNYKMISQAGINISNLNNYENFGINLDNEHNSLPESSYIIDDISKNKFDLNTKLNIFFKDTDLIIMKNDDSLFVNLYEINDELVKFNEKNSNEILSLQLIKIKEVIDRNGEIVYPILKY
ncbi:MAG: hypothetical protein CMF98_05395 [Candidatus Marinimicrobia bacterium]|nr:hypothetical protein [Candidatus Neomarinimicrobiota bacterium]OUW50090.1 MAG: hypothetical protein CBD50_03930 [bacterium TMED190]